MEHFQFKKIRIFLFLLVPLLSGVLALSTNYFLFKAGVAGSGILILWWVYSGGLKNRRDVWAILAAFLFSIAGDWFLSHRQGEMLRFVLGIALFFVAHAGYLSFALMNGKINRLPTIIILAAFLLFFFLLLYPGMNDKILTFATLAYLLISCFSLGAALGVKGGTAFKGLFVFGIAMVLFSDTLIALREFAGFRPLNFMVLPTYYLAQISVTAALIARKVLK